MGIIIFRGCDFLKRESSSLNSKINSSYAADFSRRKAYFLFEKGDYYALDVALLRGILQRMSFDFMKTMLSLSSSIPTGLKRVLELSFTIPHFSFINCLNLFSTIVNLVFSFEAEWQVFCSWGVALMIYISFLNFTFLVYLIVTASTLLWKERPWKSGMLITCEFWTVFFSNSFSYSVDSVSKA